MQQRLVSLHLCVLLYVVSLQAAQRELERQRKEEWERRQRGELRIKKEQEQDDIIRLKAKKRSLEMELEAVVSFNSVEFLEVYFIAASIYAYCNHALHVQLCLTDHAHIKFSVIFFPYLRVTSTARFQIGCETFKTRRNFRKQSWIGPIKG